MKLPKRNASIYGMAFLDVISCGFGAIVLLVLISRPGFAPVEETQTSALLQRTFELEAELKQLDSLQQGIEFEIAENEGNNREALLAQQRIATLLAEKLSTAEALSASAATLQAKSDALRRIALSTTNEGPRDEEVGGIPVDSDYVIFIIDTSGSMRRIWSRVQRQLTNVLDIHPQVKGFQVLNDNGGYLFPDRRGQWIRDSKSWRTRTLRALDNWVGRSNSSPVEGIEEALARYGGRGSLSIYVFGDDYSGDSYDRAVARIDQLNRKRGDGSRLARIHGIGFFVERSSQRFATLMREVTYRSDGTFIALSR